MQHGTDPDASPNICGAGSQVAQFRVESVIQLLFEGRICLVDGSPCLAQLQTRPQGLHAEVVLLVDHEAKGFVPIQHETAAGALGGVLAADEMTFHQDLFIERG